MKTGDPRVDESSRSQTGRATAPRNWLVWSNEHGAWWGVNRCGYYTSLIGGAVLYTEVEAKQIEREANHGVKFGGPVNERAEPLSQHADTIRHYAQRVKMFEEALALDAVDRSAASQHEPSTRVGNSSDLSSSGGDPLHQQVKKLIAKWREQAAAVWPDQPSGQDPADAAACASSETFEACANELDAALQRSQDLHGQKQ